MDPITIAALIGGGLSLGGGLYSAYSQKKAQESANAANIKIAGDQMAFQERMSSTAHQREVQDLLKAGLNPILSANHGGASTPPGATAQMHAAALDIAPAINSSISTAREVSETKKLMQQKDSEIALAQAAKTSKEQEARTGAATAKRLEAEEKKINQEAEIQKNLYPLQKEQLQRSLRMQEKDEKWQTAEKWSDIIGKATGSVTNALGAGAIGKYLFKKKESPYKGGKNPWLN